MVLFVHYISIKPEAMREPWNRFSLRASEKNQPCQHLDLQQLKDTLYSWQLATVRSQTISVILALNSEMFILKWKSLPILALRIS